MLLGNFSFAASERINSFRHHYAHTRRSFHDISSSFYCTYLVSEIIHSVRAQKGSRDEEEFGSRHIQFGFDGFLMRRSLEADNKRSEWIQGQGKSIKKTFLLLR